MATTTARRAIDYVLAGLLLLVPAAFLHSNFKNPGNLNAIDRVVLRLSSPIQRGVAWVIEGIGGGIQRYVWLVDVKEENDELRRENERLRLELDEALRAANEAKGLEALAALRERTPAETVGARVVAVGMSPYFRVSRIVLDRGVGQVRQGMPVLGSAGVVGRIQRVYGDYADVQLAVDPQSSIDVVIARTGGRGVLKGLGSDNQYTCTIEYLVRSEEVVADDLVITSGLGGLFPRGVPVGRVKKVTKAEAGLYQKVEVQPAVDFSRLSSVLVILAPPPPPDPSATSGTKKSPEPAFGVAPYK